MHSKSKSLISSLLIANCLLACVAQAATRADKQPNVVYIMADEVGWGDLSTHGGGVPTPNID
jgi:arylsulfatase